MYFVILIFFRLQKHCVITNHLLKSDVLNPTGSHSALSSEGWHAECCEIAVAENYQGFLKTWAFKIALFCRSAKKVWYFLNYNHFIITIII